MILVVYTTLMKNWRLNNMKKSLLVVPALGVMLLAAAGSVGGTVAWFSSVSSIDAQIGHFQATRVDGNLAIDFAIANNSNTLEYIDAEHTDKGVQLKSYTVGEDENVETRYPLLTHASYDHTAENLGQLWTISYEDASKRGVREASFETEVKTGNHVYYGFTWDMTFTYTFASETYVNLYFDSASSLTAPSTESNRVDAAKGFRMAFVADGSNSTDGVPVSRIWAKNQVLSTTVEQTTTVNIKHVGSVQTPAAQATQATIDSTQAANRAGVEYAQDVVMDSEYSFTRIAEGTVVNSNLLSQGFMGQFQKDAGTSATLKFKVVVWYEGTDPNISEDTNYFDNALTANMKFYARESSVAYSA